MSDKKDRQDSARKEKIMKALLYILSLSFSVSAFADLGRKAPLKADFHNMIVNSESEKRSLANGINEDIVSDHEKAMGGSGQAATAADKKKVTDFVDVEIGWGQQPKMVDRRFDSVNTPAPTPERVQKNSQSQF